MRNQWVRASGYLSIFLMPALFLTGALIHRPWLAFGVAIFVFPLARLAFGALPASGPPEWRESVATALDRLPVIYVPVLLTCALAGVGAAPDRLGKDLLSWLGLGLSLWMMLLFATCVAHELIHRRDRRQTMVGHLLAGFCGYPVLGLEHLAHHGRPGNTELAEVPSKSESMWHFAARRFGRIGNDLLGRHAPFWNWRTRLPGIARTQAGMAATVASALTGGAAIQQGIQMIQNAMMVGGLRAASAVRGAGAGAATAGGVIRAGAGLPHAMGRAPAAMAAGADAMARRGHGVARAAAYRLAALRGRT